MQERDISEGQLNSDKEETEAEGSKVIEEVPVDEKERLTAELQEMNNKYLRLYAEFENYKKRVNKDKEELVKYGNESILYELLPVIDNLEMALKHASNDVSAGLVQGVEITLKELLRTLEKFGLTPIEAIDRPFDPLVHHAMIIVERDDIDEKIVVEEFRKGYMLKDKVLRASLVAVSKKPVETKEENVEEIKINKNIEEGA